MKLEQSIEEARDLFNLINQMCIDFPMREFKQSELNLRYQTIRGILLILNNDIHVMLKEWIKEQNNGA